MPGLIHDFAGRGIPVINILNIKRLALDWGLPFDPVPLPAIGENPQVYRGYRGSWVALRSTRDLSHNVGWVELLRDPTRPTADGAEVG